MRAAFVAKPHQRQKEVCLQYRAWFANISQRPSTGQQQFGQLPVSCRRESTCTMPRVTIGRCTATTPPNAPRCRAYGLLSSLARKSKSGCLLAKCRKHDQHIHTMLQGRRSEMVYRTSPMRDHSPLSACLLQTRKQ